MKDAHDTIARVALARERVVREHLTTKYGIDQGGRVRVKRASEDGPYRSAARRDGDDDGASRRADKAAEYAGYTGVLIKLTHIPPPGPRDGHAGDLAVVHLDAVPHPVVFDPRDLEKE